MSNNDFKDNDNSINGLFKNLGKFINVVGDMVNSGENIIKSSGEISNLNNDKIKTAYNFSMKLGLNDEIKFPSSSITSNGSYQTKIEPNADIFDEEKEFTIILMASNIEEKDIQIKCQKDTFIFEAKNEYAHYYKEITIPSDLDTDSIRWNYKNGIIKIDILRR